jgi:hypothetical protein
VKFWDSSAVLALLAEEDSCSELQPILDEGQGMVVWWGTRVELVSGVCRRQCESKLSEKEALLLFAKIEQLASDTDQVEPTDQVRTAAIRVLRVHTLRAADALQLAAALVLSGHDPAGAVFVCLDKRLRDAAAREGFRVLPESLP